MGRPCESTHDLQYQPGQAYVLGTCRLCWLFSNRADYRSLWEGTLVPQPSTRLPCTHLGAVVRTELCPSCKGKIQVKVFACPLHTECTIRKQMDGVASCADCKDYQPNASSAGPDKPCGC
jgi:hypothetical protein